MAGFCWEDGKAFISVSLTDLGRGPVSSKWFRADLNPGFADYLFPLHVNPQVNPKNAHIILRFHCLILDVDLQVSSSRFSALMELRSLARMNLPLKGAYDSLLVGSRLGNLIEHGYHNRYCGKEPAAPGVETPDCRSIWPPYGYSCLSYSWLGHLPGVWPCMRSSPECLL